MLRNYHRKLSSREKCGNYRDTGVSKNLEGNGLRTGHIMWGNH